MLELPAEWKLDPRDIEVRSFNRGDVIVQPGEPDDSIYVAIHGTLAVYIAVSDLFHSVRFCKQTNNRGSKEV